MRHQASPWHRYICAFQSMKSVAYGITRRDNHNNLLGTVGEFYLPQSYTYVPPPLKKYKEYSCALPAINITKDIWCELILKNHQNEEVTRSFCQLKLLLKRMELVSCRKNVRQPLHSRIIPFSIIKRCACT